VCPGSAAHHGSLSRRQLLTFETPWGDRRYDIGVLDKHGNVTDYIETKSGNAGKDRIQEKRMPGSKGDLALKSHISSTAIDIERSKKNGI
jgi:hypothetical protein